MGPLFTILKKTILSVSVKLKLLTNLPGIAKIVQAVTTGAAGTAIFALPLPTKVESLRSGAEIQVPEPVKKCDMNWTKNCAEFLALCRNSASQSTLKHINSIFSLRTEPISGQYILYFTISVDSHLPPNQLLWEHQNQPLFSLNYHQKKWF